MQGRVRGENGIRQLKKNAGLIKGLITCCEVFLSNRNESDNS